MVWMHLRASSRCRYRTKATPLLLRVCRSLTIVTLSDTTKEKMNERTCFIPTRLFTWPLCRAFQKSGAGHCWSAGTAGWTRKRCCGWALTYPTCLALFTCNKTQRKGQWLYYTVQVPPGGLEWKNASVSLAGERKMTIRHSPSIQ